MALVWATTSGPGEERVATMLRQFRFLVEALRRLAGWWRRVGVDRPGEAASFLAQAAPGDHPRLGANSLPYGPLPVPLLKQVLDCASAGLQLQRDLCSKHPSACPR